MTKKTKDAPVKEVEQQELFGELPKKPAPVKKSQVCSNCKFFRADKALCTITLPPMILKSQDWRMYTVNPLYTCSLHQEK